MNIMKSCGIGERGDVKKAIRFRPFRSGDEPGIQKLFAAVFGVQRSSAAWKWQFQDHPRGGGWILLAKSDDELVGHFAFRRNHINFVGKEIIAGQACDAMVHPQWRDAGIFSELFAEANALARAEGLQVVFGFPNRASYPADMRKHNRQRIANLDYYQYRTGYKQLTGSFFDRFTKLFLALNCSVARKFGQKFLPADCRIVTTDSLPEEAEDMLREWRDHEVLSLWKDLDYMRWRYEDNPDHSYLFHLLYIGDRVDGMAVTRRHAEAEVICEFFHRTKDLRQSVALLRTIVCRVIGSPAQKVEFKGFDNGFFNYVFKKSGFSWSPTNAVFTAESCSDTRLEKMVAIPQNWTIVLGDMDVI